MEKVELLAPAGSMEGFMGAIHAGADAIYLGGEQFGARAYATNLTQAEIIEAIQYAKIRDKKVYLTMNTLVKEREFEQIYSFFKPFYEEGLDGVIIQDLGVLNYIKEVFPQIELHASTQMTVTGFLGAQLLHEYGVKRIVPARELSLTEIASIKRQVPVDIECFVHGAMCYCYSGQCLFSSMVGGRSGNRGRCAQPCRLPYQVLEDGKKVFSNDENYILSLKDMYTLPMIPKLIESGIDSFKIEGRMKKPEYAAGVTALYRKYLDLYYENPSYYQNKMMEISSEDEKKVKSLYIRSDLMSGYYEKHNGKEMVTIKKPTYEGTDEKLFSDIRNQYISTTVKVPVQVYVSLKKQEKAMLILNYSNKNGECFVIEQEGDIVEESKNRPLVFSDVKKQIEKMGSTDFYVSEFEANIEDNVYLNNSSLNQLRRNAVEKLRAQLLTPYKRTAQMNINRYSKKEKAAYKNTQKELEILVSTKEQLNLFLAKDIPLQHRLYIEIELLFQNVEMQTTLMDSNVPYYLALPYIARENHLNVLKDMEKHLIFQKADGVLIRNLEELQYLKNINYQGRIVSDYNLYTWNQSAQLFLKDYVDEYTYPLELNIHEMIDIRTKESSVMAYGYLPFMLSANCIKKTAIGCDHKEELLYLTDRTGAKLPVVNKCMYCFNVVYNSMPISLHQNLEELSGEGFHKLRLDFTIEGPKETKDIYEFYKGLISGEKNKEQAPFQNYTKGHLKRGVL